MKRWLRLFQPLMNCGILRIRPVTEVNVPGWMTWRSMMPNHISTMFSQDPDVGVKWTYSASQV